MRIVICDDDQLFSQLLDKYLQEYFKQVHIKCPEITIYDNGEELLADEKEKDIVFLDIEMQGINGIYVGNKLKELNKNIIIFIVTSYAEYLDDAMRFHVFRYLSKPLDKKRLFRNMKDALQLYNTSNMKTAVETNEGFFTINISDIIMIESMEKKVLLHTISKIFQSVCNMAYWDEFLSGKGFYRTHKSFIVNLRYVTGFDHVLIKLYDDKLNAYLSRRKYSGFKEAYLTYLEGTL